jgi:hypothetical protein
MKNNHPGILICNSLTGWNFHVPKSVSTGFERVRAVFNARAADGIYR